jgi:predicted metal-dependent hydrolase
MEQEGWMTPEQIKELKRIVLQGNIEEFEDRDELVDILDDYERLRGEHIEVLNREAGKAQLIGKLKAELERARPLLEAVEKDHFTDESGLTSYDPSMPSARAILRAALDYRAKREGRGK